VLGAGRAKKCHMKWQAKPDRKGQKHRDTPMRNFADRGDEFLERLDLLVGRGLIFSPKTPIKPPGAGRPPLVPIPLPGTGKVQSSFCRLDLIGADQRAWRGGAAALMRSRWP